MTHISTNMHLRCNGLVLAKKKLITKQLEITPRLQPISHTMLMRSNNFMAFSNSICLAFSSKAVSLSLSRTRALRPMQSTRQLTTDMVFLFCALGVCSAAFQAKPSTQEKKTENTYKRTITIGETSYDMNGTCLYFAAFMTSDDFFDGLRAINDSSGRRFFKGTKQLKQFPYELTIQIKALGAECSKGRLIRPTNSESPMRS